jgi:hypothetical protein
VIDKACPFMAYPCFMQVVKAEPYLGSFPSEVGPPVVPSNQLDQKFKSAFEDCKNVMAGEIQYNGFSCAVVAVVYCRLLINKQIAWAISDMT